MQNEECGCGPVRRRHMLPNGIQISMRSEKLSGHLLITTSRLEQQLCLGKSDRIPPKRGVRSSLTLFVGPAYIGASLTKHLCAVGIPGGSNKVKSTVQHTTWLQMKSKGIHLTYKPAGGASFLSWELPTGFSSLTKPVLRLACHSNNK